MKAYSWKVWILFAVLLAPVGFAAGQDTKGQDKAAPRATQPAAQQLPRAQVMLDGRPVTEIRWGVGNFSPEARAQAIEQRLLKLAKDDSQPLELSTRKTEYGYNVVQGDTILAAVLDGDAAAAGGTQLEVAEAWKTSFAKAINEYRLEHCRGRMVRRVVLTLLVLVFTLAILWVLIPIMHWIADKVSARVFRRASRDEERRWLLIDINQLNVLFRLIFRILRWAISFLVLYVAFQILFSIYPRTRPLGEKMLEGVLSPARQFGLAAWNSLPALIFVAIIALACRWVIKLVNYAFHRIAEGTVHVEGFRPQWAQVTARLINIALILLAVLIAYPYIPGSQSAAFKGFSLFLGVLVSLGSTGVVANVLNGIVLTYMDSFQKGDFVQIGTTLGYVEETSLFVTKLRTRQQMYVTVPNSQVLSGQIVNYSVAAETSLTLSTTAGIGYDTPWRQVEAMLLEAARRCKTVKESPKPFVQEVSLNSFDITYELTVFLAAGTAVGPAKAELNRSILDLFNEYGVQIMTPAYVADPPKPAVVAKENWFAAPARRGENDQMPPK